LESHSQTRAPTSTKNIILICMQPLMTDVTLRIIVSHVTRIFRLVPFDLCSLGAVTTLLSSMSESLDVLGGVPYRLVSSREQLDGLEVAQRKSIWLVPKPTTKILQKCLPIRNVYAAYRHRSHYS
jgi:hypothetical protein